MRYIHKRVQNKLRSARQEAWLDTLVNQTIAKLSATGALTQVADQYIIVTLPEFYFTEHNYFDTKVRRNSSDAPEKNINYHKPFYREIADKLPEKIRQEAFGGGKPFHGRNDILIVAGTIVSKSGSLTMDYLYNTLYVVSDAKQEHKWHKVYVSAIDGLNIYNKASHKNPKSGDVMKNTNLPFFTWNNIRFSAQICLEFSRSTFNMTLMEHLLGVETDNDKKVNQWIANHQGHPFQKPHIGILVAAGMPIQDIDRIKAQFSQTFLRCDLLKCYDLDWKYRTYDPSAAGDEKDRWTMDPGQLNNLFYVFNSVTINI